MDSAAGHRYDRLLHVDLDQFQVAVERLRSPELVGVPVIVGGDGDPTQARKVVTCASYEARAHRVRAGMPLRAAHRKLPDAVFLPLDTDAYDAASAQVMEVLRSHRHPVEVWGWDEAFIGVGELVTGTGEDEASQHDVTALAERIRRDVLERCGLQCCVGISDNKQRAKMATGFAKRVGKSGESGQGEDRVFVLDDSNWLSLMADRPTRDLWSVGPKTSAKLADRGVSTVADLLAVARVDLVEWFGPHQGNWLYVLCRGGGDRTLSAQPYVARSHSRAHTFAEDLTDREQMVRALRLLATELLTEVLAEGREVYRVAVTVRTATFFTRTKSRKLPAPTTIESEIVEEAVALLERFELDRPVRLLGVRFDLVTEDT